MDKALFFSAAGADNNYANSNNIIFIIKSTNLYVPVVPLSGKDNQKLSRLLSKTFEKLVYWNEYKAIRENENKTNENRCFLKSNFDGIKRF